MLLRSEITDVYRTHPHHRLIGPVLLPDFTVQEKDTPSQFELIQEKKQLTAPQAEALKIAIACLIVSGAGIAFLQSIESLAIGKLETFTEGPLLPHAALKLTDGREFVLTPPFGIFERTYSPCDTEKNLINEGFDVPGYIKGAIVPDEPTPQERIQIVTDSAIFRFPNSWTPAIGETEDGTLLRPQIVRSNRIQDCK